MIELELSDLQFAKCRKSAAKADFLKNISLFIMYLGISSDTFLLTNIPPHRLS